MGIKSEHSERWKTASVLLAIIVAVGLINNIFLTWIFLTIVYGLSLLEATRLFRIYDNTVYLLLALLWVSLPFYPHPADLIFFVLVVFGARLAYKNDGIDAKGVFALLYPSAGFVFLWMLYYEYGMISLVWILAIVALTDVGAFYTGKKFGKKKFSPTSPNKTLEGVFGGVAFGTLGGTLIMAGYANIFLSAVFISLTTSISSVFGDLFESYLKREAGVKDSGNILPGHGGVLDRIDGYLFASISLYVMLKISGS